MAQAQSSLARINRFGTLTTVSALGQIFGPVLGGVIIGHTEEPSLESTSAALLVAAWVFVGGVPRSGPSSRYAPGFSRRRCATGRAERVWRLLHRRGMPAALMTSFSAKSGMDLLLVYVPLLGAVVGLTSSQVGLLLGINSGGALLARAATPFFVRRISNLRLMVVATVIASSCLFAVALNHQVVVMAFVMALLGFALGLSQTTTMDWVVNLVDDTSRGSALGLRVATNRVGQAFILAVAGAVSGVVGSRGRVRTIGDGHVGHRYRRSDHRPQRCSVRRALSAPRTHRRAGDGLGHQSGDTRHPLRVETARRCGDGDGRRAPAKSRNAMATEPTSSSASPELVAYPRSLTWASSFSSLVWVVIDLSVRARNGSADVG